MSCYEEPLGLKPPQAEQVPHERRVQNEVFNDPYEWMRDKESQRTRDYVAAQNDVGAHAHE